MYKRTIKNAHMQAFRMHTHVQCIHVYRLYKSIRSKIRQYMYIYIYIYIHTHAPTHTCSESITPRRSSLVHRQQRRTRKRGKEQAILIYNCFLSRVGWRCGICRLRLRWCWLGCCCDEGDKMLKNACHDHVWLNLRSMYICVYVYMYVYMCVCISMHVFVLIMWG